MARARQNLNILLAEALKKAKTVSKHSIIKTSLLDRKERERLIQSGFMTEIIRGWCLLTTPEGSGGTTAWFGGFWAFLKQYLDERFGENGYCIAAESSLNLHAGETAVPRQIVVLTKKASNTTVELPHNTSVLLITDYNNFPDDIEMFNNFPRMSLPLALCRLTPNYFQTNPKNIEIVLKISSLSVAEITRTLLKHQYISSAERIIGAYNHLGEISKAEQIKEDLIMAGYKLNEVNPFANYCSKLNYWKVVSPYAGRIRLMWYTMRDVVIEKMSNVPSILLDEKNTIRIIQETYIQDAYHSLSIEGYQVTEELISRIESGDWDPENREEDKKQIDGMAAKGYLNAFNEVIKSVSKVLFEKKDPGNILSNDLQTWYRHLFAPSVRANLVNSIKVAGYRNNPVYITNSRHVPPPHTAILDCMDTLFELLQEETHASVKAVLGHFIFVYIHPYMDGNGRIGRFIMNLMLISGGYNWTIIRSENRSIYMEALELASTKEDISMFCEFVKSELEYWNEKMKK